jgi:hypothetical protein
MTKSEAKTASTIFYLAALVGAVYGLLFLLLPEYQLQLSQDPGVPPNPGWVRWSGGILIGIAVAAWLAAAAPERQGALITGFGVVYALIALALLYSTLSGEYQGAQWFIWVPIVINVALAAAMAWLFTKQA